MADHTIEIKIDRSQAVAAAQAELADLRKRTAEHDTAIRQQAAAERAADKQRAAAMAQAAKEDAARHKDAAKQQAAARQATVGTIKDVAAAQAAASREAAREQVKASREAAQAAKESQRAKVEAERAYRNEARNAARVAAQAARDETVAAKQSATARQSGLDRSSAAAGKLTSGLMAVSSSFLGIGAASDVLKLVGQSFDLANAKSAAAVDMVRAYKDLLRDVANMGGEPGPTNKTVKEASLFRMKTGQTQAGAVGIQEGYLNVAQSSIDAGGVKKVISPEESNKFLEYLGSRQAATGEDAQSAGKIGAMTLTSERKKRMTAEFAIRRTAQNAKIGTLGGAMPGQWASASGELAGGAETGTFKSSSRLASAMAVYSLVNAAEIKTSIQALVKATVGSLQDNTKVDGAKMSRKEYFASLGLTDQNDPNEFAERIVGDMEKEEARRNAIGERFSPDTFLEERAFTDMREKNAIRDFYGKRGSYFNTFKPAAEDSAMPTLAGAMAPVVDHRKTLDGMRQAEEAKGAALQAAKGAKSDFARTAGEAAFNVREARGQNWGELKDYRGSNWQGGEGVLRGSALENIRAEGIRVGLPWKKPLAGELGSGLDPFMNQYQKGTIGPVVLDAQASDMGIYEAGQAVARAGGNPLGVGDAETREVAKRQLEVAERMEQELIQMNGKAAPPPPSPPRIVPRPQGGNAGRVRTP